MAEQETKLKHGRVLFWLLELFKSTGSDSGIYILLSNIWQRLLLQKQLAASMQVRKPQKGLKYSY